MKILSEVT